MANACNGKQRVTGRNEDGQLTTATESPTRPLVSMGVLRDVMPRLFGSYDDGEFISQTSSVLDCCPLGTVSHESGLIPDLPTTNSALERNRRSLDAVVEVRLLERSVYCSAVWMDLSVKTMRFSVRLESRLLGADRQVQVGIFCQSRLHHLDTGRTLSEIVERIGNGEMKCDLAKTFHKVTLFRHVHKYLHPFERLASVRPCTSSLSSPAITASLQTLLCHCNPRRLASPKCCLAPDEKVAVESLSVDMRDFGHEAERFTSACLCFNVGSTRWRPRRLSIESCVFLVDITRRRYRYRPCSKSARAELALVAANQVRKIE